MLPGQGSLSMCTLSFYGFYSQVPTAIPGVNGLYSGIAVFLQRYSGPSNIPCLTQPSPQTPFLGFFPIFLRTSVTFLLFSSIKFLSSWLQVAIPLWIQSRFKILEIDQLSYKDWTGINGTLMCWYRFCANIQFSFASGNSFIHSGTGGSIYALENFIKLAKHCLYECLAVFLL